MRMANFISQEYLVCKKEPVWFFNLTACSEALTRGWNSTKFYAFFQSHVLTPVRSKDLTTRLCVSQIILCCLVLQPDSLFRCLEYIAGINFLKNDVLKPVRTLSTRPQPKLEKFPCCQVFQPDSLFRSLDTWLE